jgi:hypothetical protein
MSDGWLFPHPGEDIGAFLSRSRPSITSSLVAHWISVSCKERRETNDKAAGGVGYCISHYHAPYLPAACVRCPCTFQCMHDDGSRTDPTVTGKCIPHCEICKSGDSDAFVGGDDDFVTIEDESGGGKIRMGCLSRLQSVVEEYRANVLAVTKAVPKVFTVHRASMLYRRSLDSIHFVLPGPSSCLLTDAHFLRAWCWFINTHACAASCIPWT